MHTCCAGGSEEISIRALAERVIARSGSQSTIRTISYDDAYEAGFEDMERRVPNTDRAAAMVSFKQTLDSLEACFGANTPIGLLTAEDADHWRAWVVQDKKGSGHRKKKRTTEDNRLAAATVAKRVNLTRPSGRNQRGFVTQA